MKQLTPKMKKYCIVLICLMLAHAVLSFFGCVLVEESNLLFDRDQVSKSYTEEGLLAVWVLICTGVRIGLLFAKYKATYLISAIFSAIISAITSFWVWILSNSYGIMGGLAWTHYSLLPLGYFVIALSWVITVMHFVMVFLVFRSRENRKPIKKSKIVTAVLMLLMAILTLIVFRNVLIDWVRNLLSGLIIY